MAIVEIIPNQLYAGGQLRKDDWRSLQQHGITAIISVADEKRDRPPADMRNVLLIWDPLSNDDPPKLSWVPQEMQKMNALLEQAYVLYVHDLAGRNRLGFLLTAYFMQRFSKRRDDALALLRKKKSNLRPNKKYRALLADYERYLFGPQNVNPC